MTASFSNLSLAEPLSRAVAEMGYESMTPIQAQAIPVVLTGKDVMGAAQTGTGKTAAFSLPLLQRLLKHENASTSPARHPVRALVLLPTRELADQVAQQVKLYAKYTNLRSAVVFGGMDMKPQTLELKRGVEVLVATPGRLLDHIEAKNAVLNQVEYVVLDEADRMLDIGFLPDLQRILSYLPKQRTTLLFSATFSPEIKRLANSYLNDPVTIEVARPNETASTVEQHFYSVNDDDKRRALRQIVRQRGLNQAFVFVNSKLGCARLARSLEREGMKTTALHGDKSQDERLKALAAFKRGEVDLLVATDVAARGLDIDGITHVVNYEVPSSRETYVHRVGRTGRADATGTALTLVAPEELRALQALQRSFGIEMQG
jgi:superfamily II DNA/RNA helicase